MGIDVSFVLQAPRAQRKKLTLDAAVEHVNAALAAMTDAGDPLVRKILSATPTTQPDGGGFVFASVDINDAGINVYVEPDGMTVDSKTSLWGPGFHAAVVDFVDRLVQRGFVVSNPADQPPDETGYFQTRDFAALQDQMARQFGGIMNSCVEAISTHGLTTGLSVNLDMAFPTPLTPDIRTPMGPRSVDWARRAAAAPEAFVDRFYTWWSRERDASYWYNAGMAGLWSLMRWHPPTSDFQRLSAEVTLESLRRAKTMNPALDLPEAEMAELERMLKHDLSKGDPPVPAATGIGYARLIARQMLGGGWTLDVPGYFYEDTEQNGEVLLRHHGWRNVRFSSVSGAPGMSMAEAIQIPPSSTLRLTLDGGQVQVCAEPPKTSRDEPGSEAYRILSAVAFCRHHAAFITICGKDASDDAWMISVLKSVTGPGPEADAAGDEEPD
jgi:hypothetical protein